MTNPAAELPAVKLNKIPGWFRSQAYAAIRAGTLSIDRPGLLPTWQLFLKSPDAGGGRLFDHWGTADGRLVTEPYQRADDPDFIRRVEAFARRLNLHYEIAAASTWNPPSTCRVTFWPKR